MILVDTSVWIDHFRSANASLAAKLSNGEVLAHPFVVGELACGDLRKREHVLADLLALPAAVVANDSEVREMIDAHKLWGKGLGWVDAHLIASSLLSRSSLWTGDKGLLRAAVHLGLAQPIPR